MLKIKPEYLSKDGRREFVVLSVEDFDKIKEALEDADDLRNLREAKRKNAKHPYFTLEETEQMLKQRRTKRAVNA